MYQGGYEQRGYCDDRNEDAAIESPEQNDQPGKKNTNGPFFSHPVGKDFRPTLPCKAQWEVAPGLQDRRDGCPYQGRYDKSYDQCD